MSVDAADLMNALTSMAGATGLFAQVNGHEPQSVGTTAVTTAVWLQQITPVPRLSGLDESAARVEFRQRLYYPITTGGDQDLVDPNLANAALTMMGVLSADFTLDGEVFAVDLLGAWGKPLAGQAGYLDQAGQLFRIIDITIPLCVDAVFTQQAVTNG